MKIFKTIIILDSFINYSNSYKALKELLKDVESLYDIKFDIQIYSRDNLVINPCKGCLNCFEHLICFQDETDDIGKLKSRISNSDVIIFVFPVYLNNVSGFAKNILDRLASWTHLFKLIGKKGIIISTSSFSGLDMIKFYMRSVCTSLGIEIIGELYLTKNNITNKKIIKHSAEEIYTYLTNEDLYINKDMLENYYDLFRKNIISQKIKYSDKEIEYITSRGILSKQYYKEFKKNNEKE